jgi:hypothetical protein
LVSNKLPRRDTAALDKALRRAVRGLRDPLVARWFHDLLESGETADDEVGGGEGAGEVSEENDGS